MTPDHPSLDRLADAVGRLRSAGAVPAAAEGLADEAPVLVDTLVRAVTDEVRAYTETANPDVIPELREHLAAHVAQAGRLLAGDRARDFGFVEAHAERRAGQKFPLDAVLQSYGCLHRLLGERVRDAALAAANEDAQVTRVVAAAAEFTAEYLGLVGTAMTASYVDHTRRLSEAEGDRRNVLLDLLLQGYDESDPAAAALLRRAGYLEQRQSYCVAVAQSVDPAEMASAPRAQRIADSIGAAVAGMPVRIVSGLRDNLVVAVISGTRRASGWTAPRTRLADRLMPKLLTLGPAVLIGLSADKPSTSHVRQAREEATIALGFASVTERVVPFAGLPLRRLLVRYGGEHVKAALPAWTGEFLAADGRARGRLLQTLRACADADMNVLKAARLLGVHPNTVYARLARIEELTGLDARRYDALTELLLAAEIRGRP